MAQRFISVLFVFFILPLTAQAADDNPLTRRIVESAAISTPIGTAWSDWTTDAGIRSFFAPGSKVELRPGGPYEVYFLPDAPEGQRGSEGTTVLGFQKNRMLSVTWALPPYMQEVRPHLTHLTLYFEPVEDNGTRITIVHSGWGQGTAWDKAYDYFKKTWPAVLGEHQKKHAAQ